MSESILTDYQRRVQQFLIDNNESEVAGKGVTHIAEMGSLGSFEQVSAALEMLRIKGYVEKLPNNVFQPIREI